mmetsp:Transcript_62278/g.148656  ORF Transcript_62278/g.148656 Transcript_62278/m.148656 type:complete len:602 (-) Transcript_62278:120-1925(-)|eukprot:CAMPEP_0178424752 /NCGR_PEP_ID=MMETSP0689_2-20121128/28373_1 /TAXON_ID=160604 /ORGANISM="Amphidinium massartii, Strain CS-259" /LENGTH=601 /DNA_ID=CAMNT_0020046401 /DNA_START=74 /DNA_END=1879 /DNA_ORIENTATION=-
MVGLLPSQQGLLLRWPFLLQLLAAAAMFSNLTTPAAAVSVFRKAPGPCCNHMVMSAVWPNESTAVAATEVYRVEVDQCEVMATTSEDREAESTVLEVLFFAALAGSVCYLVLQSTSTGSKNNGRKEAIALVLVPFTLFELWVLALAVAFMMHPTREFSPDCGYFWRCQALIWYLIVVPLLSGLTVLATLLTAFGAWKVEPALLGCLLVADVVLLLCCGPLVFEGHAQGLCEPRVWWTAAAFTIGFLILLLVTLLLACCLFCCCFVDVSERKFEEPLPAPAPVAAPVFAAAPPPPKREPPPPPPPVAVEEEPAPAISKREEEPELMHPQLPEPPPPELPPPEPEVYYSLPEAAPPPTVTFEPEPQFVQQPATIPVTSRIFEQPRSSREPSGPAVVISETIYTGPVLHAEPIVPAAPPPQPVAQVRTLPPVISEVFVHTPVPQAPVEYVVQPPTFIGTQETLRSSSEIRVVDVATLPPTYGGTLLQQSPPTLFDILDRNHDGVLTQDELSFRQQPPRVVDVATLPPTSGSLLLQQQPPMVFDMLDRNHDGLLTRDELRGDSSLVVPTTALENPFASGGTTWANGSMGDSMGFVAPFSPSRPPA